MNFANPAVQDFVVDIMCHWLGRGIDGWRLDAAYAPGAEAWRPIVERVKAAYPDCWLLGEVIHGDKDTFVLASGLDSVTQYELWHAIWQSMNTTNLWALDWALQRHRRFCEHFRPQIFVSNHDVTRISSKLDDRRHITHAAVLLTMLPGIPSIYAGDEQGFTGEKQENAYGDDAVRAINAALELLDSGQARVAERGADGAAPVFLQADGPFRGFPVAFEMAGDGARAFADRGELLVETKVYNHAGTTLAVGDFTNEQRVSVTSQGEEVTVLVSGLESCTAQGSGGFCVGGERVLPGQSLSHLPGEALVQPLRGVDLRELRQLGRGRTGGAPKGARRGA